MKTKVIDVNLSLYDAIIYRRVQRKNSYSPICQEGLKNKYAINRKKNKLSKSIANLAHKDKSARSTTNVKIKNKQVSKSAGRSKPKTSRKPKLKNFSRKINKPFRNRYTQVHICGNFMKIFDKHFIAATIIQKYWRAFRIINNTFGEIYKNRRKLRHSFSFGVDSKFQEALGKQTIDEKTKNSINNLYKNEIMMVENYHFDKNRKMSNIN